MTRLSLKAAVGAAALLCLLPTGPAAAQGAPATQRDWSRNVVQTSEGGFRMGNPDAPVKIVEYVSLTCDHCAAFARTGMPALVRDYVRAGRVNLEYRNFVLNVVDATAALLARCGGPQRFFPIADRMLATQNEWMPRIGNLTQAQQEELGALPPTQRLARLAEHGGMIRIATQQGLGPDQARACLGDPAGLNRLAEMARTASAAGIPGTPAFLINGERVEAHDWATLEPLIRRALS